MKSPLTVLTGFVSAAVATSVLAVPTTAVATPPTTSTPTSTTAAAAERELTAAEKKALAKKKAAAKKKAIAKKKAAAKKKKALAKKKRIAKKKAKAVRTARKALRIARTKAGTPYRYGSNGPRSFDCSGLTSWAYKKVGKKLPRTSSAQAAVAKRTKKPRKGDLVFFHRGGRVYHVGLYAGKGKVFHASRSGVPVKTDRIWSKSVYYGRVAV